MTDPTAPLSQAPLPPPSACLDELLAFARQRFDADFETVAIDDLRLSILQIKDMPAFLDTLASRVDAKGLVLPFWAKIWPAEVLLGFFLHKQPPRPGAALLEIGAGVGLCGLVAAAKGFCVTISDIVPEATLFTRINILKNGLEKNARALTLDFTAARLDERYDCIAAAETLYEDEAFRPLVKFLLRHLKDDPQSEILMALNYGRGAKKFFNLAEREFHIRQKIIGATSGDSQAPDRADQGETERALISIYRMKPRKHA